MWKTKLVLFLWDSVSTMTAVSHGRCHWRNCTTNLFDKLKLRYISSPKMHTDVLYEYAGPCYQTTKGNSSLQWRHNGCDGVSNHQHHDCLLNRLFRRRSKKTSELRVTGLCAEIHRWLVNSPHKGPVTRKVFPFDDVIMSNFGQSPTQCMVSFPLHKYLCSLAAMQLANGRDACLAPSTYNKKVYHDQHIVFSKTLFNILRVEFIMPWLC